MKLLKMKDVEKVIFLYGYVCLVLILNSKPGLSLWIVKSFIDYITSILMCIILDYISGEYFLVFVNLSINL